MQVSNSTTRQSPPLDLPIGALMQPFDGLDAESTIERAAILFRSTSFGVLPIVMNGVFMGTIRPQDLTMALGHGWSPLAPVHDLVRSSVGPVALYARGAEALRQLEASGEAGLAVIDADRRVVGVIGPSDLFGLEPPQVRPRTIGGMATPFGVYLTNGSIGAGVPSWALVTTGMLLFTMFLVASVVGLVVPPWLVKLGLDPNWSGTAEGAVTLVSFCILMRSLPLAGIHAAEHMVVHAIERGEPLVPEVVARMPRVHPRCGTNLAAGASIFLGLMSATWIGDQELRLLVALLVTLVLWRPVGSMVQYFITTKRPTKRQIEMGIRSGKELLAKYPTSRYSFPSVGRKLLNSGMPQIMLGSTIMVLLLQLLAMIPVLRPYIQMVY